MNVNWIDYSSSPELKSSHSYERPAWMIGNALINGFIAGGLSEKQALLLIGSTAYRHALDQTLGEMLESIAFGYGIQMSKDYCNASWLNEPEDTKPMGQLVDEEQRDTYERIYERILKKGANEKAS